MYCSYEQELLGDKCYLPCSTNFVPLVQNPRICVVNSDCTSFGSLYSDPNNGTQCIKASPLSTASSGYTEWFPNKWYLDCPQPSLIEGGNVCIKPTSERMFTYARCPWGFLLQNGQCAINGVLWGGVLIGVVLFFWILFMMIKSKRKMDLLIV